MCYLQGSRTTTSLDLRGGDEARRNSSIDDEDGCFILEPCRAIGFLGAARRVVGIAWHHLIMGPTPDHPGNLH